MTRRVCILSAGATAGLLSLFFLTGAGFSQPRGGQEKPEFGKISGMVVRTSDGKGVPGAKVWISGVVTITDGDGNFFLGPVPIGNKVVTSDVVVKEGGFLGIGATKRPFRGFAAVSVAGGKEAVVKVSVEPKQMESEVACRACHPDRPTREAPLARCSHPSGKVLKPRMVVQNARFNEANGRAKKEKKRFYPPVVLHEHRRDDGTVFHTYDCESCHTAHVPTHQRVFVLAPFEEGSVLCQGCHA